MVAPADTVPSADPVQLSTAVAATPQAAVAITVADSPATLPTASSAWSTPSAALNEDFISVALPQKAVDLLAHVRIGTDPWDAAQARGHVIVPTMVCILCARKLDGVEKLEKHVRMSKLHLENLEKENNKVLSTLT